jgi:type IV pilus assembly protein PilO
MNNFAVVILVLIVAVAIAGGSFYMYYWVPLQEDREKLEGEIKKLEGDQKQIANLKTEIADIQEKIKEADVQKKKLAMDSNKLDTVVPKLLDSTETIANKFSVKFNDIRISPLVRSEQWSELPIEMSILGTYENLAKFLHIMEKRKIANLAAGSITIAVSAESDPKTKAPLLSVTLSAKVYIMGGI